MRFTKKMASGGKNMDVELLKQILDICQEVQAWMQMGLPNGQ